MEEMSVDEYRRLFGDRPVKVKTGAGAGDSMSAAERAWAETGYLFLIQDHFPGFSQLLMVHEPCQFRAGQIRYTPDFLHVLAGDRREHVFVEVKASSHQRGYQYSLTRLKAAAQTFFSFRFFIAVAVWDGKAVSGWKIKEISDR